MKKIYCLSFLILLQANLFAQKAETRFIRDSLKNVFFTTKIDSTRVRTCVELGEVFYDSAPDSAMSYWAKSETLCLKELKKKLSKDEIYFYKSYIARTYNNIAYYFQRNSLKTKNAFTYYNKALSIEIEIKNAKEEGKTLNNLATLYSNIGDIENCIAYHHQALRARERANHPNGIIISLNNLTAIYSQQGELKKAMEYSKKAEEKAISSDRPSELPNIYANRARILLKQNDTAQSEIYHRRALKLALKSGVESAYCTGYINMSSLFIAKNQLDSAIAMLNKALPIASKLNTVYSIIEIHKSLSSAYLLKGNTAEAKRNITLALELAQKINRRADIGACAELLSEIYKREGNVAGAFEMYKIHIAVRDSLFNETTRKNIIREQLQYDYDKKTAADSVQLEAEKKITQVQLEQEKTQRYGLYGGIMLLLVFGSFMFNRFKVSQKQKRVIEGKNTETEAQKKIIEEKQKEIVSSFNYAKRIQYSLLANEVLLNSYFKEHFVLFRPKDIVSGDFYWATQTQDRFYLAVCDCTGHGVPGAFMSLLSIGFLSEAIKERNILEPNLVFDYVRARLEESISKDGNRDGFDGVLICINKKAKTVTYAAANNNPVIVKNNQVLNLPCDKMPVGKDEDHTPFNLYSIDYQEESSLYIYTDGYADQFGGDKGKKFKYKNFEQLIVDNYNRSMKDQGAILDKKFDNWMGEYEQIDDICVLGIRI